MKTLFVVGFVLAIWLWMYIQLKKAPLLKEEYVDGLSPAGQLGELFNKYKGDTSKILEKIEKEIERSKKLKDKRNVWMRGNYWAEVKRQYHIWNSDNIMYE